MVESILYILLALFGIGFLIFIHELGHYFMARKVGITVEAFAIGFGKPLLQWEHKGVKWKLGWLPFGGYVKMAGMEKKGAIEPYQIEDGFFGKKPLDRIKVAAMGPLINLVFALFAFSLLWAVGGREKPFTEFTQYIGWVEKDSSPYKAGIRSGDEILTLNGREFKGFNDFLYGAALDKQDLTISGDKIYYLTGKKKPYTYIFSSKTPVKGMEKASIALSTLNPAQYLIYDKMPSGAPNKLLSGSPLENSGITYGDRIIWADGELIFSKRQLVQVINAPKVLLRIERDGQTFLTKVPRVNVQDLRISSSEKEEFDDWRFEAKLSAKVEELSFIPYNLTPTGIVQGPLSYIDEKSKEKSPYEVPERAWLEESLMPGDKIVGIQGEKIDSAYELLQKIQKRKSLLIVKKIPEAKPVSWKEADKGFEASYEVSDLKKIVESIGSDTIVNTSGALTLLKPVTPVPMSEFPLSPEQSVTREEKLEKQKQAIEEISDPKRREEARKDFQLYQNRLMLGLVLQDKLVSYNPSPFVLFGNVFKETYRTLVALLSGYLSPKNLMGPVGIVQVIHYGWTQGVKDALFWLGMISLNLGLLNLLPIPVLDGGHICFAVVESITKKPIKAKTMERLILPFIILLIALFVYLTYNDIARIITHFF